MKKERKGEKRKLTRRTLHYYWQATKKHKGLFATGIIVTPIVTACRTALAPYFTADIIGKVSAGINPVENWSAFMWPVIGLLACYLIGSELLGHIRIWAIWKLELRSHMILRLTVSTWFVRSLCDSIATAFRVRLYLRRTNSWVVMNVCLIP